MTKGSGYFFKKSLSGFGSDHPGIFKINWKADYYSILDYTHCVSSGFRVKISNEQTLPKKSQPFPF